MSRDDWETEEPSAGFADRVMAGVREETGRGRGVPPSTPKLRGRVAGGVALAVLVALLVLASLPGVPRKGDATAAKREEVHLGRRAVAVLEAGAHVSWDGDLVTQTAGDVFYRVEGRNPGNAFHVRTPEGDVEVLGTCFRVRLENAEVPVNKRDVKMGSLGAALGAVMLVSVYEGKVGFSHEGERVTLLAGESARADKGGIARDAESATADPLVLANANLADSVREYERRLDAITAQKASVERQLQEAKAKLAVAASDGQAAPYRSEYDLSEDDWKELAKEGKARARFPCPDPDSWKQSPEVLKALGLAPEDEKPIHEAMEQSADRIWAAIRPLCVEALEGNVRMADKLGPRNCQTFVLEAASAANEDTDEETRKVAEIRAGLIPMPADPRVLGSYGRMVYTLTGESRAMEQQLAQSFGPETAHRLVFGPEGDWCNLEFAAGPRPARP